jgi:hypothetical protein
MYMPLAFILMFILWAMYRLLFKKDLKQQLDTFYLGITFIAIWGLLYFFLLN